ncbi:CST complex subunit STN1 [Clonorchis sinensis]|uniref:CST complex subunit STN1 n=1 Tax=Clonorchis sinensis TaxID=79923 RepID=G7YPQ4_CLOSI|nr:CST complex subunit STN1 [Clonorchis sinensis]
MSLHTLDDSAWLSVDSLQIENSPCATSINSVILDPLANEHYQLLIGDLLRAQAAADLDIFRLGTRWLLYVDLVGLVRTVFEREKFWSVEIDDGTGCISCTVWRHNDFPISSSTSSAINPAKSAEYHRICDQLLQLSNRSQPTLSVSRSAFHVGDMVHLKGRLKRFRGQLKVNVHFCRFLDDPAEQLKQLVHRNLLMHDVYSKPYDPELIAKQVTNSHTVNCARSFVDEARRIFEEDSLTTFTKVDLFLNDRLTEQMSALLTPLAFDVSEADCLTAALNLPDEFTNTDPKNIQKLVESLMQCLLREGWIYPATEPIGGHAAFHTTLSKPNIVQHVCDAIAACQLNATNTQESGVSESAILKFLRRARPREYYRLTLPALGRVLNVLEGESKIYQTKRGQYKLS